MIESIRVYGNTRDAPETENSHPYNAMQCDYPRTH